MSLLFMWGGLAIAYFSLYPVGFFVTSLAFATYLGIRLRQGGGVNPLSYDFMQYAVLAGTFTALAAGLVGYFVVLRNEVFTSDTLGHVAFTGGLGAVLAGFQLLVGVFGSTIAVAVGLGTLGGRSRGRDVAIGTVFAWVLGLGVSVPQPLHV